MGTVKEYTQHLRHILDKAVQDKICDVYHIHVTAKHVKIEGSKMFTDGSVESAGIHTPKILLDQTHSIKATAETEAACFLEYFIPLEDIGDW